MLMLFFVFSAFDSDSVSQERAMQYTLLALFFSETATDFQLSVKQNAPERDPCASATSGGWTGVCCKEGIVDSISYEYVNAGNFCFGFLPNSLQSLSTPRCSQISNLEARLLPLGLRELNVMSNTLYGRIDLRSLPPRLETCNASMNKISGAVNLTGLPASLMELDLSANHFRQKVVYYAAIPPKMAFIDIRMHTLRGAALRPCGQAFQRKDIRTIVAM